jgi:hypothetical protein
VPSASRSTRFAVLSLCGAIAAGSLTGCETTQEKAAAKRVEAERILEAREKRQQEKDRRADGKDRKEKG